MNRQVNLKDIVELIDEKIDGLNQQNSVGALIGLVGWFDADNINRTIDSNKIVIKDLTDMRMKVLEI